MEVKILIKDIENLKTTTCVKVEKDKDGEIISRRLMTKVQLEAEVDPASLAIVHRLLASEVPVHALIGSPQSIMEAMTKEPALTAGK